MIFEQDKSTEKLGEKIGFAAGYFLFTTILFLILLLLNKLPASWTYLHIMAITLVIVLMGFLVKRLLK
jgi:hypothetical protein